MLSGHPHRHQRHCGLSRICFLRHHRPGRAGRPLPNSVFVFGRTLTTDGEVMVPSSRISESNVVCLTFERRRAFASALKTGRHRENHPCLFVDGAIDIYEEHRVLLAIDLIPILVIRATGLGFLRIVMFHRPKLSGSWSSSRLWHGGLA